MPRKSAGPPRTLLLIHHSHTDIGYTELQGRIARWHADFIRQALDILDRQPEFKWQCETFWQVEQFLAAADSNERERFLDAVRSGRIGISGSYLNFNELLDQENLTAVTRRASDWGRTAGRPVTSAMTADINGYSWGFAQALLDGGVENLFTCIHTHHGMYPLGRQQTGFWWEAPQGQRILVWSGEHYHLGNEMGLAPGAGASYLTKDECDAEAVFTNTWALAETRIPRYLENLEAGGYPFDFVPLMVSGLRTDNGPPSPEIAPTVERWNRKHGDLCRVEMATLEDFFALLRPVASVLPCHRGDWPDWWADGMAGNPGGTRLFRQAQRDLALFRSLAARFKEVAATDPDGDLEAATLQELALYSEHTFSHQDAMSRPGHFLVSAISGNKQATAARSVDLSCGLLDGAASALGAAGLACGSPLRWRVVNPDGHRRRDLGRLIVPHHEFYERGLNRGLTIVDTTGGRELDWVRESVPRGEEYVVLLDIDGGQETTVEIIPGQGPATWPPTEPLTASASCSPGPADPEGTVSTSHAVLNCRLGEGIVSWQDATNGRELLRSDRPHAPFCLIHEVTPATPQQVMSVRGAMGLNRKGNDVRRSFSTVTAMRTTGGAPLFKGLGLDLEVAGCRSASLDLRCWQDVPRLDATLRLHKKSCREPENLYLSLPFGCPDTARLWLDKAGAMVRPRTDQIPGSLTDFYSVQNGLAWTGPDGGIAVATQDCNLIQLGPLEYGTRRLMGDPRLDDDPAHAFAWLMTNYWETNFAAELGGFHEFRFSVVWGDTLRSAETARNELEALARGFFCFRLK